MFTLDDLLVMLKTEMDTNNGSQNQPSGFKLTFISQLKGI